MREQRRFIRIEETLQAAYRSVEAENDAILEAITRNVSGGGISLMTQKKLDVGQALRVTVHFPGRDEPLEFTAAVVWSDPLKDAAEGASKFESGLRFMDISDDDRTFIINHASKASG